eukprot:13982423-Heterocapsa_arctica.AAC.1
MLVFDQILGVWVEKKFKFGHVEVNQMAKIEEKDGVIIALTIERVMITPNEKIEKAVQETSTQTETTKKESKE